MLPGSRKLIGSCAHALDLLVERRLGQRAANRRVGEFRLLCFCDEVLKLAKLHGGRGSRRRFIECIAKAVRFAFSTALLHILSNLLVANWATSLQSYYFFEKMILGDGCVRMRFQAAGLGLVQ